MKPRKLVVVYQAGIANVFYVDAFSQIATKRGTTQRQMQCDFRRAEDFAYGYFNAGGEVRFAACNEAGDIAERDWTTPLDEAPFAGQMRYHGARYVLK